MRATSIASPPSQDKSIHVFVFAGMADWEPAHALAELRRWGRRSVTTIGFDRSIVRTMGGLDVKPTSALSEVVADSVELLIVPGGDVWEAGSYPRSDVERLVRALVEADTPVAAICAGTLVLARAGVLNDRRHTSNSRDELEQDAAGYRGHALYIDAPVVRDRHVITASGLAPVDFARAVFAELVIFSAANEELWFDMFKHSRLPDRVP